MNTEKLARTTFVIDRDTADQLAFISKRMNVSQSALVRDVLAEPVALMAKWVASVPDKPTKDDAEKLFDGMQGDLVDFIEAKAKLLEREKSGAKGKRK